MRDALRVAVLLGGVSAEREISLLTGRAVAGALRERGHTVEEVELNAPLDALASGAVRDADVVFPALHGGWGEDGRIQALLELAGRPYVGSGPGACAVAMDKIWSKGLCRSLEIPTADWAEADPRDAEGTRRAAVSLGWPVVLKPVAEGSSAGVHICEDEAVLVGKLACPDAEWPGDWMLERFVPGRELTLPVLFDEAMATVEIRPREGFYDYRNKYTAGATEYLCPAPVAPETIAAMEDLGMRLYRALRLRDMARIDFRMDPGGNLFVLEANTIPGMTELSLLPMGAKERGIGFGEMCERLCQRAQERGGGGSQ